MPVNDVSIHIEAEDRSRQAFRQAEQSLDSLERQTRELQGATRATAAAVDQFGGVYRDLNGRLRDVRGRFVGAGSAAEGLTRSFRSASGGVATLTSSLGRLSSVAGGIGIAVLGAEVLQLGRDSVSAAVQLESFTNAFTALEGSTEFAKQRIEDLRELARSPGVSFEQAVQGAVRLKAIGTEAENADRILREVGNAMALVGNTDFSGALLGLTQIINRGKVSAEELNQLTERSGIFAVSLREAFGSINSEQIQAELDAAGQGVNDFVERFVTALEGQARVAVDSTQNTLQNLGNTFNQLQSTVGTLFLPTVRDAALALSDFFEAIQDGINDVSTLPPEIQTVVSGAKDMYDSLQNAVKLFSSSVGPEVRELAAALSTLLGGILDLSGSIYDVLTPVWKIWGQVNATVIALIAKLAQDVSSLIGVLTDFVDWVGSAWREEDRFTESTQRVSQAIETVSEATKGASVSVQDYQRDLTTLLTELASVNAELEQKKARLDELKADGLEPTDASLQQIVRRIALLEERSKSLTGSLPDLNQALEGVNEQLEQKQQRLREVTGESQGTSASAQQLQRQIANLTTLASLLNTQIAQTTTELTETAPATETASQAVENYGLTLARLKAEAEDARDTLSNTIDFQKLGTNYQAAVAASDAYYARQIANAQAALSQAEANSDEYFKIETNLFNLRRDQVEARKKLAEAANAVARTEAERRIEIANEEKAKLQQAGEETARALAASQKRQAAAAEAEQKRLTQAHEENLKQREEAERASNARIVEDSQTRLQILQDAFEHTLPESVDRSYQNIQQATIAHYDILKNQARERITDEDALNAELVSLDRQRNAELEDNHRTYLTRIASDAKALLGERTDAFKSASDEILHNWERTVSEFERQLREADTEDAVRAIESDFTEAQQQMLASLEAVLTELGFTAEQASEIMKEVYRTAEGEADSFADKVISAFKRLGKEAARETKQQNREIERNYRELVGEIEHILSNITDFFIDITRGGDIEDAFRQLGERVAESFLDVFTRDVSQNLAASITNLASETDVAGAAANRGGGAGSAIQAAGGLTSILSLITSPVALAAIIPAAVGAATYYIGRQVAGGTSGQTDRLGRPLDELREDQVSRRRRGESQASYDRRIQAFDEDRANAVAAAEFRSLYQPLRPLQQAIAESGIFTGDLGVFADAAIQHTEIDPFGNVDLPGLVGRLDAIIATRVEGLSEDMERAAAALENTTGSDLQPALDEYFTATTDFYQTQIDFANFVRRTTGNLSFGDVEELSRQLQDSLNQARLQDTSTNLTRFGIQRNRREAQVIAESSGTDRQAIEDVARAQYGDTAYDAEIAAALETDQDNINAINVSIANLENTISQSNDPTEIVQLLQQIAIQIPERYRLLREALQRQLDADEITQAAFDASIAQLNIDESVELERNSDAMLANTIRMIDEGIGLINASITSIETQIAQSNDPAEIAQLLSRIPDLTQQKYQMLRDALDARYNAGEISVDVYNASLSELQSNEARDLEQHSDAVLANTLRSINEDVQLIDASISEIQTQIDGLSEPEVIVGLLNQLPVLITEKYQKLRAALDERYAAGEISVDVYNASLTALATTQTAETERHSDAVLAQTLANIDDDVQLIDANIGALQLAVEQSDDPEAIAGLLDAIKLLVADKYSRLRERLDERYAAEEISTDSYNAALLGLSTAESRALADIDTQALNAISAEAQEQVSFINGAIENLRLSLQLTDDPTETQRILDAIKVLVSARFDVLIEELNAIKDTLTDDQFSQALRGLELGKQVALENIDTEKFDAISAAAARQVDFINDSIENLRLSLELTDNPTEAQQILDAIKVLTSARFQVLRDELNAIKDTLKPEEFEQALKGINLGEQLALENLDTEKFDAISAEADRQVGRINGNIENLRLSLQLTDDSAEQQQILDAIKTLTVARFRILRDELIAIQDSLKPEEYNQALKGLNFGEQLAIQNLDTEKLNLISAEAQKQVDFINGTIENLRLAFELTDDPVEAQQIIGSIKILTSTRFDVLRDELEAIRESLSEEEYNQALKGLNLGEQVALKNLDTEKFDVISTEVQEQVDFINGSIENLRLAFQLTDDFTEQQQILNAIKVLVGTRFDVLIQELKDIEESLDPEDFRQALQGLELGRRVALQNIDTEKFDTISVEAEKQVGQINGAIDNLRLSLQLTDDPAEAQQVITAIKVLTVARFQVLRDELEDIRDTLSDEEYNQAFKGLNLGEQLALKNLDTEKFDAISAAAQEQVEFINGAINNLELALQLTDDPTEIQRILTSIRTLTAARFDRLIQELKDLEETLKPEEFNQTLEGLQLGKQVALKGIDERSIGVTLTGIGESIGESDSEIAVLFDELETETTATGVQDAINRLRTAITTKYQLMRDKINESADTEEEKVRQIATVNFQEGQALERLGQQGIGQFQSLVDTAQFLLDNATEAEFETRRENLITAINTFYDERIAFINGLDLSDTDRANMQEVVRIQREITLGAVPEMHRSVAERLELEQELQAEIQDLRDDSIEAEADRLETIADLQERHNQRIVDLEEELNRDIEDLRRDRFDDAREDALDYQRDLEDLQTEYARKLFGDSIISFGDLTAEQRRRLEQDTDYQRELFDLNLERDRDRQDRDVEFGLLRPGTGGYNFYRQQLEGGQLTDEHLIRQLFGTQGRDDFIDFEQGTQDADQRLAEGIIEATTQYETSISENTLATEALTAELHRLQGMSPEDGMTEEIATLLSDTAVLASATAQTESDTAMANAATAETQQALIQTQETAFATLQSSSLLMNESALNLQTAVDAFALIPESFDDVVSAFRALPEELLNAITPVLPVDGPKPDNSISSIPSVVAVPQTDSGAQRQPSGSQEMRITLVGDFGDGFIQKVAEALVTLDAEGRSVR